MDNSKILSYLYEMPFDDKTYYFSDIIKKVLATYGDSNDLSNDLTDRKLNNIWSMYRKAHVQDLEKGIVPLFEVVDENAKQVNWICSSRAQIDPRKKNWLRKRHLLYKYINSISDRKYEALGCSVCELLGANNIMITAPGNEGGIDFVATIKFSQDAHYLFGLKGPIRIIGQSKKYSDKVSIQHMKEFVETMNHVHNLSYRPGEILPVWFKNSPSTIVAWHISHKGHQSGALNIAKNYGIIESSTKDLVEIIAKSKALRFETDMISVLNQMVEKVLLNGQIC